MLGTEEEKEVLNEEIGVTGIPGNQRFGKHGGKEKKKG